jgi:hypothetical protein
MWICCMTRSFVQQGGERDLFAEHCEDHLCCVPNHGASHVLCQAPYACGEGIRVWLFFSVSILSLATDLCASHDIVAGPAIPNCCLRVQHGYRPSPLTLTVLLLLLADWVRNFFSLFFLSNSIMLLLVMKKVDNDIIYTKTILDKSVFFHISQFNYSLATQYCAKRN